MLGLLYVSRSRLPAAGAERALAELVAAAAARNAAAEVTGALLHTGASFAQWLEGPEGAVEAIMGSILIDRRHRDVHIVRRAALAERLFPAWNMVLVGYEAETEALLQRLRAAPDEPGLDAEIDALLAAMARDASARP